MRSVEIASVSPPALVGSRSGILCIQILHDLATIPRIKHLLQQSGRAFAAP